MSCAAVVACMAMLAATGCDRVTATREFSHGVRYFDQSDYPAAARAFERASETLEIPEVRYNVVLSQLNALKAAGDPPPADTRAALAAVDLALASDGLSLTLETRLHYIAGVIHQLANDEGNARASFDATLALTPSYAPALRALIKLAAADDSPLARLVLATTPIEEPPLERDLPL